MFRKLRESDPQVVMTIDGAQVTADIGETVAAVLLRRADGWCRETPVSGARRGPYCMMGVCFDCLAEIDGVKSVQTCLTVVREGMTVIRQRGERGFDK
jgi:predicted molibdopterin-dependent oxidoreductase YjgC